MLEAALAKTADFMNKAVKPVLVCGAHMRSPRARAAMVALAEATGAHCGDLGAGLWGRLLWQLRQRWCGAGGARVA